MRLRDFLDIVPFWVDLVVHGVNDIPSAERCYLTPYLGCLVDYVIPQSTKECVNYLFIQLEERATYGVGRKE